MVDLIEMLPPTADMERKANKKLHHSPDGKGVLRLPAVDGKRPGTGSDYHNQRSEVNSCENPPTGVGCRNIVSESSRLYCNLFLHEQEMAAPNTRDSVHFADGQNPSQSDSSLGHGAHDQGGAWQTGDLEVSSKCCLSRPLTEHAW